MPGVQSPWVMESRLLSMKRWWQSYGALRRSPGDQRTDITHLLLTKNVLQNIFIVTKSTLPHNHTHHVGLWATWMSWRILTVSPTTSQWQRSRKMCAAKMGRCKRDHWDFKPIPSFFLIIHVIPPDFKNIFKSRTYLEAGCLTKTNIIFDQLITTLIQVLVKQFAKPKFWVSWHGPLKFSEWEKGRYLFLEFFI